MQIHFTKKTDKKLTAGARHDLIGTGIEATAIESTQAREDLAALIQSVVEDQGYELEAPIEMTTKLVGTLGFSSLDFVQLIVDIEAKYGRKLGFQALLLKDGAYVKDVSFGELLTFVESQLLKEERQVRSTSDIKIKRVRAQRQGETRQESKVDQETVREFRKTIRPRTLHMKPETDRKNPSAIFVLSPPRSGSTLLRVILAGHPQLFAPPELYLLMYDDLAQRRRELAGEANSHLLEGTIRALMELRQCSAENAESEMNNYEQRSLGTKDFYRLMQEKLEGRYLVDKTPLYPLDPNILAKAELDFEDALYIHLVRHPYGMIRSYEESKLDRFTPVLYENRFERSQLAELTWLVSHQNILEFKSQVPMNRWLELQFEALVTQPQAEVTRICNFAGIELDPAMLDPYSSPERRMLSGKRELTRMPGDLKFHLHKGIEPEAATRWQYFLHDDFLGDLTWDVAESLGYRRKDMRDILSEDAAISRPSPAAMHT